MKEDGSIKAAGKDLETGESFEIEVDPENGMKYKDSNGNYVDIDKEGKGKVFVRKDGVEIKINEDGSMSYKDEKVEMKSDGKGRVEAKDSEGNYETYQEHEDGSIDFESGDKNGVKVTGVKDTEGNYELNAVDGSQLTITQDYFTVKDTEGKTTTYTKEDIDRMVASGELKAGESNE
jgi:hypothetical protein